MPNKTQGVRKSDNPVIQAIIQRLLVQQPAGESLSLGPQAFLGTLPQEEQQVIIQLFDLNNSDPVALKRNKDNFGTFWRRLKTKLKQEINMSAPNTSFSFGTPVPAPAPAFGAQAHQAPAPLFASAPAPAPFVFRAAGTQGTFGTTGAFGTTGSGTTGSKKARMKSPPAPSTPNVGGAAPWTPMMGGATGPGQGIPGTTGTGLFGTPHVGTPGFRPPPKEDIDLPPMGYGFGFMDPATGAGRATGGGPDTGAGRAVPVPVRHGNGDRLVDAMARVNLQSPAGKILRSAMKESQDRKADMRKKASESMSTGINDLSREMADKLLEAQRALIRDEDADNEEYLYLLAMNASLEDQTNNGTRTGGHGAGI